MKGVVEDALCRSFHDPAFPTTTYIFLALAPEQVLITVKSQPGRQRKGRGHTASTVPAIAGTVYCRHRSSDTSDSK